METEELKAFIDSKFRLPVIEGEDKVCSLDDAIRTHVKKGMSIGFAGRGGARDRRFADPHERQCAPNQRTRGPAGSPEWPTSAGPRR